ncbi:MAG: flagellar export protein FliJ [Desulfobacterales bacterium]|jgi:flagellar FliJ protein
MYRFNLEPLLNHRRYQEEILQKELAGLKVRLAAEKDKLWLLRQKKRKYVQQLHEKQTDGRPASEIKLFVDFVEQLAKEMEVQRRKVLDAERDLNLKRQDLVAAMKERKTLDRLKEKGLQAYEEKQLKAERNLMDEVASRQLNQKP